MNYVYASTDAFELETLVDPSGERDYKYHEFGITEGQRLEKLLGFNPMSSVELNGTSNPKTAREIATKLVKMGLFASVYFDGQIEKFVPQDMRERNELLTLFTTSFNPLSSIIWYSNNPNKIVQSEFI